MPYFPQALSKPYLLPPFVNLPGGPFVMGSSSFEDATPHWVHLSPFQMGLHCVTEDQYRNVTGKAGREGTPGDHPATYVSWNHTQTFLLKLKQWLDQRVGLPTEAEWEFGARGPAVNLREVMEEEGFSVGDFADFVEDRFENFVEKVEMGARILTDPTDEEVRRILKTKNPLYAWRVFGTLSGRLTDGEAWQSVNQERMGPPKAGWGPVNASELKGMAGGVCEWVGDPYDRNYYARSPERDPMGPENGGHRSRRGGSWRDDDPLRLHSAFRDSLHYLPGVSEPDIGFRVAAASNFLREQ